MGSNPTLSANRNPFSETESPPTRISPFENRAYVIIAHGTWLSTTNRFFVWGETEPYEETSPSNGAHPHQLALEDVEQKLLRALADEDTFF